MATSGAGSIPDPRQAVDNPEVPEQTAPAEEHDLEWYKTQYEQLRPEYTRTTQARSAAEERASQYEALFEALNDPEQAPEILRELGYDFDDGSESGQDVEPEDEFADPLEQKVAELEGILDEIQKTRQEEARSAEEESLLNMRDEYIDNAIQYIKSQPGTPALDDDETDILGNLAITMADQEGVPDVIGAYNRLYGDNGIIETNRERWIDTKNGAIPAPLGHSGSSEQRPTNRRERVAYFDSRMRALDAQQ